MKRTGIIALAAGCALGATALVGGVGYASALDVAAEAGTTLDVAGINTVDANSEKVADATIEPSADPTAEASDASGEAPTGDATIEQPAADDTVDEVVLKPVATAYQQAMPAPVRTGVSNFFGNLGDAWSFVNNTLQ